MVEALSPCARCGIYHRFGTTDPEHEPVWIGCINGLRDDAETLATVLQRILVKGEEQFGAPMINELNDREIKILDHHLAAAKEQI